MFPIHTIDMYGTGFGSLHLQHIILDINVIYESWLEVWRRDEYYIAIKTQNPIKNIMCVCVCT